LPYSIYTAAALSLLLLTLSLNISRLRLAHKISFGDGGVKELAVAVRAHGNSLEQSVLFIPLLYLMETHTNPDPRLVFVLGGAFVLLRVVYCVALFRRALPIRQMAHVLTLLVQLVATVAILVR
jgi:uncharacterized membrane protein YecN with MAPEG domain